MDEHREMASWRLSVPVVVLFAGWGLLFALPEAQFVGSPYFKEFILSYQIGTLFAHATLCAVWTACGPLRLYVRLPLALVWLASFGLVWLRLGLDEGFGLIVFAAVMYGYVPWLLLQFPLGVLVYLYGLRLEVSAGSERSTSLQFGLRQLMVITACLAIILAGGRVGLPWLTSSLGSLMELSTVAFVYIACLTTALLTFLAMLLPRYALPGVVGVLLLIGVFTLAEPLLFAQIQESADPDMTLSLFAMLNGILVSWTLLIGGLLRWAGYRWATRPGIH